MGLLRTPETTKILSRKLNPRIIVAVLVDPPIVDLIIHLLWILCNSIVCVRCQTPSGGMGKCNRVPALVLVFTSWVLLGKLLEHARSLFFSSVKWGYHTRSVFPRVCSLEHSICFAPHLFPPPQKWIICNEIHSKTISIIQIYTIDIQKGCLLFSIFQNYFPTVLFDE